MALEIARPHVLLVEDETLVAMLLEDMLLDISDYIVEVYARLSDGIAAANTQAFAFAILDVNLDGLSSFPIADILKVRGTPFLFSTGYGTAGLGPCYADTPTLQKPFRLAELRAALAALLSPAA